jgi:ribosome-binding factor A
MKRDEQGGGHRHARLQDLLFEELRALFADDVSDPILSDVAVVAVVLSVDYRHARVHYAVRAEAGARAPARTEIERALGRATPFLRRGLADALDLKIVPDLRFVREPWTADGVDGVDDGGNDEDAR